MLRLSLVRRLLEEGSGDSNQGSGSRGTVPEIQTQLPAPGNVPALEANAAAGILCRTEPDLGVLV